MITETFLASILVLSVVAWRLLSSNKKPDNFPPGPRGLPLVGYAPFTGQHDPKYPHKAMVKLAEIYGPIVGFYLGPWLPFISVCGYDAVREVFQMEDLNGRPIFHTNFTTDGISRKEMGIIFANGNMWQEHRRFTLRRLRDLGLGKASMESQMLYEVQDLIQYIKSSASSNSGNVFDFKLDVFNASTLNILWAMVAGRRFSRDDQQFQFLVDVLDKAFRAGSSIRGLVQLPEFLYEWFPILRKYFGLRLDHTPEIQNFVLDTIEALDRERNANNVGEESDCLIHDFLNEMYRQKDNSASTFTKEQLIASIMDLFTAGTETSSNTIGFALLWLLHHPECQERMQEELDEVCGANLPSLADKPKLPYTEAVLMEVQRMSNIAPNPVPHCALKDIKFRGYIIPKGSIVMPNIYSVHMDPAYWEDPENFRPERHLNPDKKIIRTDHLIPFGAGRRICMGEALARNTFFLFTASLVKAFRFKPLPNKPLPTLEPRNGFTLAYEEFQAVVLPRE